MTASAKLLTPPMETVAIGGTSVAVSRIGLGTWAIGGWMWGGTDEQQSIRTIHEALDRGITLFDTAPVYGSADRKKSLARHSHRTAAATAP